MKTLSKNDFFFGGVVVVVNVNDVDVYGFEVLRRNQEYLSVGFPSIFIVPSFPFHYEISCNHDDPHAGTKTSIMFSEVGGVANRRFDNTDMLDRRDKANLSQRYLKWTSLSPTLR